jgi:hypothetical protein
MALSGFWPNEVGLAPFTLGPRCVKQNDLLAWYVSERHGYNTNQRRCRGFE